MEEIKKKLKASFKRLQGNRIISMKQNHDCLEEVLRDDLTLLPLPQEPWTAGSFGKKLRFKIVGIPKMVPGTMSKEFNSCFQKPHTWGFPVQSFPLQQLGLWEDAPELVIFEGTIVQGLKIPVFFSLLNPTRRHSGFFWGGQ